MVSASFDSLMNQYYAMRHGRSMANESGIIVSDPDTGTQQYGLSPRGIAQVDQSLAQDSALDSNTLIVSSDFLRARQTAELVARHLGCKRPVRLEPRLRERYFGELDGGPDDAYPAVWALDATNPAHTAFGAESVIEVVERGKDVIDEIEASCSGTRVLLIAHGDVLQILQTAFAGTDPSGHRNMPHLATAELRRL